MSTPFARWMHQVSAEIEARAGLSYMDLADQPYRDWWEDGVKPVTAARRALRSEGF